MQEHNLRKASVSPWLIAGRVIFTFGLIACIVFIFSNSMKVGNVSEAASGRVLALVQKVLTHLGMPGAASHGRLDRFCGRDDRSAGGNVRAGTLPDVPTALYTSK